MADCSLVKEIMEDLAADLHDLGYDAVLETVEGSGEVGRAVRDCRYNREVKIVGLYMKDLARTFLHEMKTSPSPECKEAMGLLDGAWKSLKLALSDDPDDLEPAERVAQQQRAQQVQQMRARQQLQSRRA